MKKLFWILIVASLLLVSCGSAANSYRPDQLEEVTDSSSAGAAENEAGDGSSAASDAADGADDGSAADGKDDSTMVVEVKTDSSAADAAEKKLPVKMNISFDDTWEYADFSKIHTDPVILWFAKGTNRKNIVVAVNAGHGCTGGESEQTLCHPDGTAKVTGGSTSAGATTATAINNGMTFDDGTKEAAAVLQLAKLVKEDLLQAGFDVLMIRDNDDTQLDNIARTVFANNCADCHISLHYDSTAGDKGFFYIRVPDNASYKAMEPVASHWEDHDALGEAILAGVAEKNLPVFSGGSIALDLTQTSYSTVPSVDLEVGDKSSDHSEAAQKPIAEGITAGLEKYFKENPVKEGGVLAELLNQTESGNGSVTESDSTTGDGSVTESDSKTGDGSVTESDSKSGNGSVTESDSKTGDGSVTESHSKSGDGSDGSADENNLSAAEKNKDE